MTDEELAAKIEFGSLSPDEARGQIAIIKADPKFWEKRNDPMHPGFKLACACWDQLHRQAYQTEKPS